MQMLYKISQLGAVVHSLGVVAHKSVHSQCHKIGATGQRSAAVRFGQSLRLGALGGSNIGLGATDHPIYPIFINAGLVKNALPYGLSTVSINGLGGMPLYVAYAAATAAVGMKTPTLAAVREGTAPRGFVNNLLHYGLLGLPQAAFVSGWRRFDAAGRSGSANVCLLGATVASLALEPVRVVLAFAILVTRLAICGITITLSLAYNLMRWAISPRANPEHYTFGLNRSSDSFEARNTRPSPRSGSGWHNHAPKNDDAPPYAPKPTGAGYRPTGAPKFSSTPGYAPQQPRPTPFEFPFGTGHGARLPADFLRGFTQTPYGYAFSSGMPQHSTPPRGFDWSSFSQATGGQGAGKTNYFQRHFQDFGGNTNALPSYARSTPPPQRPAPAPVPRPMKPAGADNIIRSLQPILAASTLQEARTACIALAQNNTRIVDKINEQTAIFTRIDTNLTNKVWGAVAQAAQVFATSNETEINAAWATSRFKKAMLYLHPDKFKGPGRELTAEQDKVRQAGLLMMLGLRTLHENYLAAKNNPYDAGLRF